MVIEQETKWGFKNSIQGIIPDDWNVFILDDLTKKIGSGITPTGGETVYLKEGRPLVRSQNIGWGKLLLGDVAYINDETHQTFPNTEIKLNDVFLNITGASIGRSSIADKRLVGGNVNQHVCIIRAINNKLNPFFLNHFLLSKNGQKQIDSFQSGGNRQGLNIGQIKTFQIPLPYSIIEQEKIATVLSDTDTLIDNLEKLIQKKKAIKQGTMQLLLTGKKRLQAFSGEWKSKMLGEIGNTYGGLSGKTKNDFEGGKFPYIPFMNIMSNPIIDINFFDYVNIRSNEYQNKAIQGDLFFNGSSETPEEVGMCAVLQNDIPNLFLNSFCFGFRLKKELLTDGVYISYFFRSPLGRKLIFSLAQGATRYNLSKTNFLKLEIPYPNPEEQTAIAKVLLDMDIEIEKFEQKREKYIMIKQGMMQQLLTGRIRINGNN